MTPLEEVCRELREIGYTVSVLPGGYAPAEFAVIDYSVETGRYKGRTFKIGIGFQESAYPEYPPHWICVEGLSVEDVQVTVHSSFQYEERNWILFSVPPNDFWDGLSLTEKNMRTYLMRHVVRFWDQL